MQKLHQDTSESNVENDIDEVKSVLPHSARLSGETTIKIL